MHADARASMNFDFHDRTGIVLYIFKFLSFVGYLIWGMIEGVYSLAFDDLPASINFLQRVRHRCKMLLKDLTHLGPSFLTVSLLL